MGQAPGGLSVQLEDRYFLQKVKLGQGSFGTVWRAVDRQKGNTVAIKQLDKLGLPRRGVTRKDIEREVTMMRACSHENITQLYDTFEDATSIYLALEYCDGGDFGDKVKERGWGIEEAEVAGFMRQICAAIRALHNKGICHRDIKPDNFMVSGSAMLKLSDFGLAIFLPRGQMAREKCGTPAFMAPELHSLPKRSPGYSFPVDIWAAGVSMYMVMFGGRHPFINDHGHIDEHMLLAGELDFRDKDAYMGFFNFGAMSLRFSEDARLLCSRMVEPDPRKRISTEDAMNFPWLHSSPERARPTSVRRSPSPGAPPPAQPCAEKAETPQQRAGQPSQKPATPAEPVALPLRGCENLDPNPGGAPQARTPPAQAGANRKGTKTSPQADRKATKAAGAQEGEATKDAARQEAARLKEQNDALQAELTEWKKREEALVHQQKQLKEQQRYLQRQRTKELHAQNEKLLQREMQLQRVEQEKRQLELQRPAQAKAAASVEQPKASEGSQQDEPRAARPGYLQPGLRCRYESGTYGWMEAIVQSYNEGSGTYNLDVRPHAALDKISPLADVSAAEAWPAGTLAAYHSVSVSQWLPAVVISFNEADNTYNLDVRDHADPDRIRARIVDKPGEEAAKRGSSRPIAV